MKMKKMISICFLFVLVIAGALWIDADIQQNAKMQEKIAGEDTGDTTEEAAESMSYVSNDKYYLTSEDGRIVIYESDRNTLYCETAIRTEHLPKQIKESIADGMTFQSEKELYEFLENYSS